MEIKFDQICNELSDKRETLSKVLEKNGKLESQINELERKLNEAKHSLIQSETTITELNHFKSECSLKNEQAISMGHEFENEKARRVKTEKKCDELKDELKKCKQKANKLAEENATLKSETIEIKNQLDGFKSKLNMIADKSHTEFEKNNALQDELNESKKKLELAEVKCSNFSDKFDLLLKKYEDRKIKQKNKVERLWYKQFDNHNEMNRIELRFFFFFQGNICSGKEQNIKRCWRMLSKI